MQERSAIEKKHYYFPFQVVCKAAHDKSGARTVSH